MKPIDQIQLNENGKIGDCFRACIASLLEMPAEKVPHFYEPGGAAALRRTNDWLAQFGYAYAEVASNQLIGWDREYLGNFIAVGPSPRGDFLHAVIGNGGGQNWEIVHDPHPSRDGIESLTRIGFIVAINPKISA